MSDLIRREDALHAIGAEIVGVTTEGRQLLDMCQFVIKQLPSAEPERKAPISYKEQLSLDCSFCRQHECGDTLYESAYWDGGIGFDYIGDIRFCPICGRELYGYEDEERLENE